MTAYEQRSYPGAAADTLLNADLTNVGVSFSVTPGTGGGYPDGSQGPFFVILDWDNSKAEKIRCSGRVNDTFTVAGTGGGRAQDGTSAQAHTANAKVRAVITATDIQEANRAAANTIGKVTTKGDLLAGTGANALTRVAAGADGLPLVADSTQTAGVRFGYDNSAWTAYAPGWAAATTVTTSQNVGRYRAQGKHVFGQTQIVASGVSAAGPFLSNVPVTPRDVTPGSQWNLGTWLYLRQGVGYFSGVIAPHANGTEVALLRDGDGGLFGSTSTAGFPGGVGIQSGDVLWLNFNYESA